MWKPPEGGPGAQRGQVAPLRRRPACGEMGVHAGRGSALGRAAEGRSPDAPPPVRWPGPQYELLVERAARAAVRAEQADEVAEETEAQEHRALSREIRETIQALQKHTESTKQEVIDKHVNAQCALIVAIVEQVVQPQAPELWREVTEVLSRETVPARAELIGGLKKLKQGICTSKWRWERPKQHGSRLGDRPGPPGSGQAPTSEPLHFGSKQIAKKRGGVRAGSD
jgi:hypothetical protein